MEGGDIRIVIEKLEKKFMISQIKRAFYAECFLISLIAITVNLADHRKAF